MLKRIAAIDVIRGYCLVNIFVNHIVVGVLHRFSPSNFGLSDSADLFVFLSGLSTFLAFGKLEFAASVRALLARSAKLYGCNLILIACTLAILGVLAALASPAMLQNAPQLNALGEAPLPLAVWNLLTLQQSVGLSMILRLYVGLMVVAPLFLVLAKRRWWLALPPAALVWLLAGQLKLVDHDSLTGAPLMLSVLPWTVIFVAGLTLGAAMSQGVRLPRSPLLTGTALALVGGYLAVLYALPHWSQAQAWVAARDEVFWLGASKSMMSPLRLLHLLALAYLFIAFRDAPVIRLAHRARPTAFLAVLGRRSLPVFVTGAVLAEAANELLSLANRRWGAASATALAIEALLVVGGIAALWIAARTGRRAPVRPGPATGLTPVLSGR